MDITIRPITPDDAENFFGMMCLLDEETEYMMYEPGERTEKGGSGSTMRARIEGAVAGGDLVLVAVDKDEIVGFIWAQRGNCNRMKHTAYIVVGIRKAYRGLGIGTDFFKHLDNWAEVNGIVRLSLTVECENVGAKNLYLKSGFQVEGICPKSMLVNGRYVDEYYMGKIINDYSNLRLETEHLILKKSVMTDWKALYDNVWRHAETAEYMLWEATDSEEEAQNRMRNALEWQRKTKYALTVYLKATDEAIGWANMVPCEADSFEISGVALGPDYVQKGYGREIMEALEEAARSEGAVKIISSNRQGNVASRELQRACGYVLEGLSEEKEDPYTGEKYFLENNVKYL
ncbi:MAG: GNAT family N-acetyltransferase [Lachnospiraceae bacterium]|nr:GNAT family N-acetyltransferase [Lachnospiraceae bacterium]